MGTYIFLKDTDGERVPAYRWEDMKGDSLENYRNRVKPGWAIVCGEEEKKKAAEVIVEAMQELEKVGIITDFRYDLDGAFPGLEVLRVCGIGEKPAPLELTTAEAIEVLETYDQSDDNDDEEFKAAIRKGLEALKKEPKAEILDEIKSELLQTAEKHEDGDYYLHDKWVSEIIDKFKSEEQG